MSFNADVKFKGKGAKEVIEALSNSDAYAKIGILGGGTRTKGSVSNAEIGLAHEFGTSKLPMRSFLRMPLTTKLFGDMKASGMFKKKVVESLVEEKGGVIKYLKAVAVIAEGVVQKAFDTGGFGEWPASNMKNKKNKQTLVESTQLRRSITSEVVDK